MSDNTSKRDAKMSKQSTSDRNGWERKLPNYEDRDWITVQEAADILLNRKVIHRDSAQNRHGSGEITGLQQVRKYIRNGEIKAKLYENSRKYGYIIDKEEIERFCREKKAELRERYLKYLNALGED